MKNQLLFIIIIAVTAHSAAQTDDLQWLILDNLGKQGTSGDFNFYPGTNSISSVFHLAGVKMPNSANDPAAFNDLFIIYSDGTHFNSRFNPPNESFFRASGGFTTVTDHSFKSMNPAQIMNMYFTNGYEEDDLPRRLMVNDGNLGSPHNLVTTTSSALTANHDAVLTKDITLIINMDSVRNHFPGTTYRLYFDGVEPIASPSTAITGLDIYDPSAVFNNKTSSVYPEGGITLSDETASWTSLSEGYFYLNLRANANALLYPPDQAGDPQYNALFRIVSSGAKPIELREPIRFSHDPNFLRVDSICRDVSAGYYIYYHLEFENENDVATTTLSAKLELPDYFDPSCIKVTKWVTGGVECDGDLVVEGDSCKFTFSKSGCGGIIYSDSDPSLAIGYVEFRVKVDPGYAVTNVTKPIRLNVPAVYMDGVPTEITDFRDLINAKGNPFRPTLHHPCSFCKTGPSVWMWLVISGFLLGGGMILWRGYRS